MHAKQGDQIVIDTTTLDALRRHGEVIEVIGVACQRDGTTALPRPRDHLGVDVMVIGSPPRVNQDTPVAAGWRVWPGRWRRR
jgi:hypothetical protein